MQRLMSILSWGFAETPSDDVTAAIDVSCGMLACVALETTGDAITWGDGGDASGIDLTDIADISCGDVNIFVVHVFVIGWLFVQVVVRVSL